MQTKKKMILVITPVFNVDKGGIMRHHLKEKVKKCASYYKNVIVTYLSLFGSLSLIKVLQTTVELGYNGYDYNKLSTINEFPVITKQ